MIDNAITFIQDNARPVLLAAIFIVWGVGLTIFYSERAKYRARLASPDPGRFWRLSDHLGMLGSWLFLVLPLGATVIFLYLLSDPVGVSTRLWGMLEGLLGGLSS